jgi:hypothetical protein
MKDLLVCIVLFSPVALAQRTYVSPVPRTWDTVALSDWGTPLANINLRPGYFSEAEYYKAPVDNYRTFPVYDPAREPAGYWDSIRGSKPVPLIDLPASGSLDWPLAGKRVWEELDVPFFRLYDTDSISMARSAEYFRKNRNRIVMLGNGTSAIYRWVVTPQGIALGVTACASCHTRVLPDGSTLTGPGINRLTSDALLDRMLGRLLQIAYAGDTPQQAAWRQFGVPWIPGDIHQKLKAMSDQEMGRLFAAEVPGVTDRPNGSPWYITKIPDLIGIRDRMFIDHTATHQHRGPGDLMRYAALIEYADAMDFGAHRMLGDAQRKVRVRWPDELLYALAQYLYSLQPPTNPNPRDAGALAGEGVRSRRLSGMPHPASLYQQQADSGLGFSPPKQSPS